MILAKNALRMFLKNWFWSFALISQLFANSLPTWIVASFDVQLYDSLKCEEKVPINYILILSPLMILLFKLHDLPIVLKTLHFDFPVNLSFKVLTWKRYFKKLMHFILSIKLDFIPWTFRKFLKLKKHFSNIQYFKS